MGNLERPVDLTPDGRKHPETAHTTFLLWGNNPNHCTTVMPFLKWNTHLPPGQLFWFRRWKWWLVTEGYTVYFQVTRKTQQVFLLHYGFWAAVNFVITIRGETCPSLFKWAMGSFLFWVEFFHTLAAHQTPFQLIQKKVGKDASDWSAPKYVYRYK